MGGSLGMAAGEGVIAGMMRAVEKHTPFVLFAASGGARMQEGILSLMQMPRTTIAVQMLREARLPYLVVLTDPTTGGVTASYAMLGDVHIAEPGALICFAGPRVIQQTIREQLPEGFQKAEYLLAHGMVDMVVHRHQLRETLARLCRLLNGDTAAVRPSRSIAAAEEHGYLNGSSVEPHDDRVAGALLRRRDGRERGRAPRPARDHPRPRQAAHPPPARRRRATERGSDPSASRPPRFTSRSGEGSDPHFAIASGVTLLAFALRCAIARHANE